MDEVFSAILEFILEAFIGLPMESKKVKVWVKTTIMVVLFAIVQALFLFCGYFVLRSDHGILMKTVMVLLNIWWLNMGIRNIVSGHKSGWKDVSIL